MKKRMRKKEGSIPWVNLLIYLLGAYILTIILLLVLALLLYKFRVSSDVINVGIIITYMLTSFFAGNMAGKQMQQKRFVWGMIMGLAYFVVLLVVSLVINSSISAVSDSLFTTMILCAGGGMLGGMLS